MPISLPSAKPTLPRRIAVDLSNREERSTHSLERLQSLWQKTTRDIRFRCVVFPPCVFFSSNHLSFLPLTLSSLCLLFCYISRVFEPPSTLRGLRMPRATDWLSEQRARGRRERTSNSSVPNVYEYSRTSPNAIRPTIVRARTFLARLPRKTFDNPCALIPSTYFYGLFERLSLKVTSFFPSISHSFEEFVHQYSTQLRERNKYGTFTWHIHVFRGCVNSRITRFWNFSTTLMFYDNDAN